MNKQRILKEAQKIAAKFPFWMVSGNIAHLYGYVHETTEKKYELEIKFDDNFPKSLPHFIFYDAIRNLLGDFQLYKLESWTPESSVVDILHELKEKIKDVLIEPVKFEEEKFQSYDSEEYITPDLNAYPPDSNYEKFEFQTDSTTDYQSLSSDEINQSDIYKSPPIEVEEGKRKEVFEESEQISIEISTELGLIQQYFTYDQKGTNPADINVYMTITFTKTFIININFTNYPEKPFISFPDELKAFIGDPHKSFVSLKKWNKKNPPHIIEILQELEKKLLFIKDIEIEVNKIHGEYKCEVVENTITKLKVHILTYGFKKYLLDVNLKPYPKPPDINLTPELQNIIQIPISSLNSYKNWKEKKSEPIEIIREISWLIDKNSRINFEIELLKDNYKNIKYNAATEILNIDMKGKMKTHDLMFEFQIELPKEYPMKVPEIKVLNEFELESHEKIKTDLQASFKNFFSEWTPFSYLIDLFNLISKKIFEISVVACVICHKIECPTCQVKIAGTDKEPCHVECPYCDRTYHKHCWEQTIKSFGKCGFCLKTPPPEMIP